MPLVVRGKASIWVEIWFWYKKKHMTNFKISMGIILDHFWLKYCQNSAFSYCTSKTSSKTLIFGMHTHISPRYNIWSLTLKATIGHWKSSEVKKSSVINEVKTQKQIIFKKLIWQFLLFIKLPFKWYTICEIIEFYYFHHFLCTRPHPWKSWKYKKLWKKNLNP